MIYHLDKCHASSLSFYSDIWFGAYTGDNPSQSNAFSDIHQDCGVRTSNGGWVPKQIPNWDIKILNALQCTDIYKQCM